MLFSSLLPSLLPPLPMLLLLLRVVDDLRRTASPKAQLEVMICDLTDFE